MIETFSEWYGTLPSHMQVFWGIALCTSLVFSIQMVLTFIGVGDTDADVDFCGDMDLPDGGTLDVGGAMQLFSIRNLINFLLGLGWGGVCLSSLIPSPLWLTLAAILVGAAFVYAFILIYRQLFRLEKNGAFSIADSVGMVVDVYLTIPANRKGSGKVQVSFYGSVQELSAITTDTEQIHSGAKVKVLEVIDGNTVLVTAA